MGEEANCERCKARWAGHRGALTRLTRERDKVRAVEMLNNEHYHKLDVMYRQME